MKLILFQLSQLERYQNIKIEFHRPKAKNEVLNLSKLKHEKGGHANYVSILRDPITQKINLYYANNTSIPFHAKTCLAISDDGIRFEKPNLEIIKPNKIDKIDKIDKINNVILSEGCFSNNMNTFIDHNAPPDERYKAVGGLHISTWYVNELGNNEDKEKIKESKIINLKPLLNLKKSDDIYSLPHPAFIRRKKSISRKQKVDNDTTTMFYYIDPTQPDPEFRGNGIFLYVSADGIKWKPKFELPIISGMMEGHYDKLYFCSHYDCHPSCFYDKFKKEYIIYLRSNIDYGVRHVQYSTSTDLIDWSPLKFINFKPSFDLTGDNYYSMNAIPYPDSKKQLYIAFPPYYKNKTKSSENSFISLAFSEDAINWKICDKMITPELVPREKISSFPVYGLIISNDQQEFYFYEHRYRSKIVKGKDPIIVRYAIRRDGFSSISSGKEIGYFQTKLINFPETISINFQTESDGYINLEFLDSNQEVFQNKKNIKGDHLNYEVELNNTTIIKGYIKITLNKARVYALDL